MLLWWIMTSHLSACNLKCSPPRHLCVLHAVPDLQAVFNFIIAWTLMLGPLMFADRKAARVPRKFTLWVASMVSQRC